MDEQPTPAEVIGAIKAGDYDGQLVELVEAVRARFQNGSTEQKWKVTYDGEEILQDSLTLAEAATVEKLASTSWAYLSPVNSARECQAVIAAFLHHRKGVRLAEAVSQAGALNLEAAVAAVGSYEVQRAPKDSAA